MGNMHFQLRSRLFLVIILIIITGVICLLTNSASGAPVLDPAEVETLKQIGKTLGKQWDFSVDPCSGQNGWITEYSKKDDGNNVTCSSNCSDTVCHVVSIVLKRQGLQGTLPPELNGLPYLQQIDLTRNYLNGTIPSRWASLPLVTISLVGNRLTGPIPEEFGNITTLESLTVEFNSLSGPIPPELGNLPSIQRLHLTSNYFTGVLPETLKKLTTLQEFRIGDNNFSGKIPDFIQSWSNLSNLVIQASGLEGPIPTVISTLTNLTDLRISDLNGTESTFPPLNNSKNLQKLILRSCNIVGELPSYLGTLTNLKVLDLSFNKLTGSIPNSSTRSLNYIYLTGNLLSGSIPDDGWMPKANIDLSYNNLTFGNTETSKCQQDTVNLFRSSSAGNTSGIDSCLVSSQCPKDQYFLFINCGGSEVAINGSTYEADDDPLGPSNFVQRKPSWAISSTGHFLDDDKTVDSYISTNTTRLPSINYQLYMNARLSPLSLTYYGFCLSNGMYTVKLHFSEIQFIDDKNFSSLGRRIFDVYIQGKLELKDFNIAEKAGGFGREHTETFRANVTKKTLEIRFYWAGRGTTGIPSRGVYGPLISAISAVSDGFKPDGEGLSVGKIVGIVAAVVFVIFLILGVILWRGCLRHKDSTEEDLKGVDLQTGKFTLRQINAATNNFNVSNKIGEGGFGSVYKGLLSDGTIIAVKHLSSKSKQGNKEFLNEIGMISALQHPHLVKLYGCCVEGNQLMLVYEYMENNSLARALFGPKECQLELGWQTRHKICIGIARGLAFLHEESRLKIVHRDIKATNVLLDKNLDPKISDFGLAKLDEEDNTHISTRIAGTYGYMAPEYAMRGYLTDKADVYSFGIVVLEIISGRSNCSGKPKEDPFYLHDWALSLKESGNLEELIDPRLVVGSDFKKEEVMATIHIALLCTSVLPAIRPYMSSVVSMLEGKTAVRGFVSDSTKMSPMNTGKTSSPTDSEPLIISSDGPFTASSASATDLYPMNLYSDYLERRV